MANDGARPCGSFAIEEHRRDAHRQLAYVFARRGIDEPVCHPRKALDERRHLDDKRVEGIFPKTCTEKGILLFDEGKCLVGMAGAHKRDKLGEASLSKRQHEKRREQNACGRLLCRHARNETAPVIAAPQDARHAAFRGRRPRHRRSAVSLFVGEKKSARRELHPVSMQVGIRVAGRGARCEHFVSRRKEIVDDLGKRLDAHRVHTRQIVEYHKRCRTVDLGDSRCDDAGIEIAQKARAFAVDPKSVLKRENDLCIFCGYRRLAETGRSHEEARDVSRAQKFRDKVRARVRRGGGDVFGAAALACARHKKVGHKMSLSQKRKPRWPSLLPESGERHIVNMEGEARTPRPTRAPVPQSSHTHKY